ncbi:MAG: hypothetical protein AAF696_28900 [Bacteroidota bacterium]
MSQEFFKYLDNEIGISELEQWMYRQLDLEASIGERNSLFLLEFDYRQKFAQLEIRNFILKHLISEKEFAEWKMGKICASIGGEFPQDDLYTFAKQHPKFLEGKVSNFIQIRTGKEIEIIWAQEISPYIRHVSELQQGNEQYLCLGAFEKSYINLLVKPSNEIYLGYDIIDQEDYFAPTISQALLQLILGENE